MPKSLYIFIVSLVCLLLYANQADAYSTGSGFVCVDGSNGATSLADDFQDALDDFRLGNNGINPDDEIRLIAGIYTMPATDTGHFQLTVDHSFEISGGWKTGCSSGSPVINPSLTILQGDVKPPEDPPPHAPFQTGQGGVLFTKILDNSSPASATISNLTIQNGKTNLSGGGLYFEHATGAADEATLNVSNIIAQTNIADTFGSGIAIFDEATAGGLIVNLTDCIVKENSVSSGLLGGPAGIYIDHSGSTIQVAISRCQILSNNAEFDGGGLKIDSGLGNTTLVNNVIAGNTVLYDNGGGLFITNSDGSNVVLTNNTITDNTTQGTDPLFRDGGGLFVELYDVNSNLDLYNNIIYDNLTLNGTGADIFIFTDARPNSVRINNNDYPASGFFIEPGANITEQNNNIDVSPGFINPTGDNYRLMASSPALDVGDNSAPSIPPDDLDGVVRPQNSIVDMGAYEYQATTTTSTTTTSTSTTTTLPPATTTTTTTTTSSTTTLVPATTSTTTSTTLPSTTTTTTTVPATTTTTLPSPPLVLTTSPPAGITTSAATLEGQVNPNNDSTTYYFEYGLTTAYGSATSQIPGLTGNTFQSVSADISGLATNSTFHYRLVAFNTGGTSYGTDRSFATLPDSPTVLTGTASGITASSATLGGQVNPNNDSTTYYFEYGLTAAYGSATSQIPGLTGNTFQAVSAGISGLASDTIFHYRLVAFNTGGTSYGSDQPFATLSPTTTTTTSSTTTSTTTTSTTTTSTTTTSTTTTLPPTTTTTLPPSSTTTTTSTTSTTTTTTTLPDRPIVTTGAASEISSSAATLEGQINPNNGSTTYYFEYGLTTAYGSETLEIPGLSGGNTEDVSQTASDLELNTTYNYRLVAYNAGGTSEGANRSFTTAEKNTPKAGGEGCFIATAINGN